MHYDFTGEIGKLYESSIFAGTALQKNGDLALEMLVLVPRSAGLECVFSSVGFVHSDLRNRLGPEKVAWDVLVTKYDFTVFSIF